MLDKRFTLEERTRCFIGFFASVDARSQNVINQKLLLTKHMAQACVRRLLQLREAQKKDPDTDYKQELRTAAVRLARFLPGSEGSDGASATEKTMDSILELIAHPDNNAARFLASCANPSTTRSALLTDRKELLRVVGASSRASAAALKEFTRRLLVLVSMTVVTADSVPAIMSEAQSAYVDGKAVLCNAACLLLKIMANKFPQTIGPHFPQLLQLLQLPMPEAGGDDEYARDEVPLNGFDAEFAAHIIEVIALATHNEAVRAQMDKPVLRKFLPFLRTFALDGTVEQAQAAIRALVHLHGVACHHSTPGFVIEAVSPSHGGAPLLATRATPSAELMTYDQRNQRSRAILSHFITPFSFQSTCSVLLLLLLLCFSRGMCVCFWCPSSICAGICPP